MKFFMKVAMVFLLLTSACFADESATSGYFDHMKSQPAAIRAFLKAMPKGADLHNHMDGAIYAEQLIRYGIKDNLCINPKEFVVSAPAHCAAKNTLASFVKQPAQYNALIDAWSMRNYPLEPESARGLEHFFAAINHRYDVIPAKHPADILARLIKRAAAEHVLYLELMTPEGAQSFATLGKQVGFRSFDMSATRDKLLARGLDVQVKDTILRLSDVKQSAFKRLKCHMNQRNPACKLEVRFQMIAFRDLPPAQVFGQLVGAFEIASRSDEVVGINLVGMESGQLAMRDYSLHMQMIEALHALYPKVHIDLHAGEFSRTTVPPEAQASHIRQAVEVGMAERIGHGTSISADGDAQQLIDTLKQKQIAVEINLTSNKTLLGVFRWLHPLRYYLHQHVPIVISTDDAGVLRTSLSNEFAIAALDYDMTYEQVKDLVRNSLQYSFLPGKSLWTNADYQHKQGPCDAELGSPACKQFLSRNLKATLQLRLERQLQQFETHY